ncbi:uncharacterized protein GIQ15_03350 [Arthroderma uncinatum]|uniref:uncharacterized protein n=1 Tax=Arthroderma uncinatum TaxID=74035 RepID=UPI00144ABE9F|nr:uncharacterized protein GIQ15_03350 [Arthroderma uncinatum]KAF3484026.1 hypothetical protein GIQ15_03350 [Arthroderma uncinatum]
MSSTSAPRDDIDIGLPKINTPGSPIPRLQRGLSEPRSLPSASSQNTPANDLPPVKCTWCGQEFPLESTESAPPLESLKQHMREDHPDIAKDLFNNLISEETLTPPLDSDQGSRRPAASQSEGTPNVEEKIERHWTMHDVRNFTEDYDGRRDELQSRWEGAFDGFERPQPYESGSTATGKFLPLTDPNIYIDIMKDPSSLSTKELYAITVNAAHALRIWQDEHMALEKLIKRATRSSLKKTSNPRELEDPQVYEDKKEAMLYGYKHDPKVSQIGCQDPFAQGGFIPTADQMRKMKASGTEPWKMNRWASVKENGVECVPKLRPPPVIKPKKKVANTAVKTEPETKGLLAPKRITRYGGSKPSSTRDTSQAPSEPTSPGGPSRPQSRNATPSSNITTPLRKSGRPLAQALYALSTGAPRSTPVKSPKSPKSPAPTSAGTSKASTPFYPDPLQDPKNQLKIKNSKHPKRTEAMILHWAKFNQEGRTRNPKRTKAQIEAARVAEREASLDPSVGSTGRKRMTSERADSQPPSIKKVKRDANGKTEPVTPVSEHGEGSSFHYHMHAASDRG